MITSSNISIKPVLILTLTFHLFVKQLIAEAENKENEVPPSPPIVVCQSPIDLTVDSSWLETVVFGDFRIWHIMFSCLGILIVIAVLLCCLFRCRIPRTKQEIEADYTRRKITKLINTHLRKIKLEELEYDPTNLLPVLKRVEDLEENRVKKHRSFEMRRSNWRQKIKQLFIRKDISFEDEVEDQKADVQGKKMTKEEMEKIEKEVESAKIDSTAFNIITDQIAILSNGFESEKTRKKRLKKEKREQKKLEKERRKKEKREQKKLKKEFKNQPHRKSAERDKLLELKASELAKDLSKKVETNRKKSEDKQDAGAIILDMENKDKSIIEPSQSNEIKIEKFVTESKPPEHNIKNSLSKFSFRNTVLSLMSGFRSKNDQKPEPLPENKNQVRDEIVINIGMVARQMKDDEIVQVSKEFENIPQIKVPENEDFGGDKNKKLKHKHRIARMNAVVERNRLQIPEVTIKEINVKRDNKKEKSKIKEPKIKEEKNKKDKGEIFMKKSDLLLEATSKLVGDMDESAKLDEKEETKIKHEDKTRSDKESSKSKLKDKPKIKDQIKEKSKKSAKELKKDKNKTKTKEAKNETKEAKNLEKTEKLKSKDKTSKSDEKDQNTKKLSKDESEKKTEKNLSLTHHKRVIFEPSLEMDQKILSRESSESKISKSLGKYSHEQDVNNSKLLGTLRSSELKKMKAEATCSGSSPSLERSSKTRQEFANKFYEHKKHLIRKQITTSSSEIEIPVEHFYTGPRETTGIENISGIVQIQVHNHPGYKDSSSSLSPPSLLSFTSPLPVEHMETVEKFVAASPIGNQHRKLIIEKTRNVMFDVGEPSSLSDLHQFQEPQRKSETEKPKKKKKVKLLEAQADIEPKPKTGPNSS